VTKRQGQVLTVIGEALVDLVSGDHPGHYQARPGGAVAKGACSVYG
jgi:hypothetical protein